MYKDLQIAKQVLEKQSEGVVRIKNSSLKEVKIKETNALITLLNNHESILNKRFKLVSLDGLLCARMHTYLFQSIKSGNDNISEILLKDMLLRIDNDLRFPNARKESLISLLETQDFVSQFKNRGLHSLRNQGKEFTVLVDNLLHQIKTNLVWS